MANLKASKKDIKNIKKRTARNRQIKTSLKSLEKKVKSLIQNQKPSEDILKTTRKYISSLDKASKKNIIHRNKANRLKKRFSRYTLKAV